MFSFLTVLLSLVMGNFVTDSYKTDSGKSLEIGFIAHGSVAFDFEGTGIYVDPAEAQAKFAGAPKADFILYTHGHGDHFDKKILAEIVKNGTVVICNEEVGQSLADYGNISVIVYQNGDSGSFGPENARFGVKAVPSHNQPANYRFHPPVKNNGSLFEFDGLKVLVAGDTEDIEEWKELKKEQVDIAFLPVNQPYTMTFEQAVNAVSMFEPKILYPYHFGPTHTQEGMKELVKMLSGYKVEVKIRPLE